MEPKKENRIKHGYTDEALFNTYFTVIPDLFFLMDKDGYILDYRAHRDSELYAPAEAFLGKRAADILPPPVSSLLKKHLEAALREDGVQQFEYDIEIPAGLRHYECRMSRMGDMQHVLAVVRDTTREHSASLELANSEVRFRGLLENTPYAVFIADLKTGHLAYCNERAKEKFVCGTVNCTGKTVGHIFTNPGEWEEILRSLRENGPVSERETTMRSGDGSVFWAVLSASAVNYQNEPVAMIALRDISVRKAAERELEVERLRIKDVAKKQECLNSVLTVTGDHRDSMEELLNNVAGVIGTGLLYPEIAEAQIQYDSKKYATQGFRQTPWSMTAEYTNIPGDTVKLTVVYLVERPEKDEGPFLKEERALLDYVAKRIAGIIEHRKFIESIQEHEQLMRIMFEHVAESIILIDPADAKFVLFNDQAATSLGYTKEEFAKLRIWDIDAYGPPEEILDYLGRVSRGGLVYFEASHRCKNGETKFVEVALSPLTYGGRPLLCETGRDITEEKKRALQNQKLTDDLLLYNRLLGEIGTLESGINGNIERFSREVTKLLGDALSVERVSVWRLSGAHSRLDNIDYYNAEENAHTVVEPLDLAKYPVFNLFYQSRRFTVLDRNSEDPLIRNVMEHYHMLRGIETVLQCGIFTGGRPVGTISFSYQRPHEWSNGEITFFCQAADQFGMAFVNRGRVDAVNALKVSEAFLNRAQKVAKTGHWHYNLGANRLTMSKEAHRIFGIPAGPPLDLNRFLQRVHPDDREKLTQGYIAARKARTPYDFRYRIVVGCEIFWVNEIGEFYFAPDGNLASMGTVQDITETYTNYLELENYRNHLEDLVALRTKELQGAKLEADNASKAKSLFLSNMSHEIRTPMNAIIGYAHLMKKEQLSPTQQERLEKLTGSAQNLLGVINDILDISKIEAQKIVLDITDFEPARVIDQICAIVADLAQRKDLNILVDLDSIPQMLKGDSGRLGQILLNLLANAVKFTDKGGVTIKGRIAENKGDSVRLRFEIIDTGIGIDEADMGRLFNAFEQADVSTTRRYGGTGLGLAISKQLTELMGGQIGVTSESGRGSTFFVEIPFETSDKLAQSIAHLEPLEGKKAIVIDDAPDARELLSEMLTSFGLSVDAAASGSEGLEKLKKSCMGPDGYRFLVVDYRMPELDGVETVKKMRALKLPYPPEIIMVTAYSTELPAADMVAAGISAVLEKPVTPSRINDTLTELLDIGKWKKTMGRAGPFEKKMQGRTGARLLLVEDNEINQEVTVELLRAAGFRTSVAQNGREAVQMVRENAFDLILMDVQMPVMDGLQATRAIRKISGMGAVPIIAMTANAFEEDRRKCMEAGMNDHVAKPVKPENLYAKIISWLPEACELPISCKAAQAWEQDPAEIPSQVEDTLAKLGNMKGFDVEAGLRVMRGDRVRYARLLRQFAASHGGDARRMEELLAAGDTKGVLHMAHALKGVAGTLGAAEIQRLAEKLERLAQKDWDTAQIKKGIADLSPALERLTAVTAAAQKVEDAAKSEPATLEEKAEAAAIFEKMKTLLARRDTAVNDLMDDSKDLLYQVGGRTAEVLDGQIQEYEYREAQKTLEQIEKSL